MIYDWEHYSDLTPLELRFVIDSLIYCYTVHRAYEQNRPDRYKILTNSAFLYAAAADYSISEKSVRELLVRLVPAILGECPE